MPQHSAKDRLFAALLVEHHDSMVSFVDSAGNRLGARWGGLRLIQTDYRAFLRREVKRNPAYLLALKQIEAAHGR